MEKQVNWRALSELGSHRPDRRGGGGEKAIRHGKGRWRFCLQPYGNGLYLRREKRGEMMDVKRTECVTPGRDALVFLLTFFFFFSVSPSSHSHSPRTLETELASTANTWLLMCFSVLSVWVRQNAKSIMLFLPHFLFDATSKSQWTGLQSPTEGKKPVVRYKLRIKVQGYNFSIHSFKTVNFWTSSGKVWEGKTRIVKC